jgi:hypothetical protein
VEHRLEKAGDDFLRRLPNNFEQNDFKKICRAKHVLSRVEGTPGTQRKNLAYFSEPWRHLPFDLPQGGGFIEPRLCARHDFPFFSSSEHFKYLWLDLCRTTILVFQRGK